MRHEKAGGLLELARRLAASAEGLTLDEMAREAGVGRRTAERMRDALWLLFPQMEEAADGASKRFRIPHGLDSLFQSPTTEELAELGLAAAASRAAGAEPRARRLEGLERKLRAAMRGASLRRIEPDLEALARSEAIAVHAGPRPFEDETVVATIRHALLAMKALAFVYRGGSRPGARRSVAPYGLMFGRTNYLVGAELGSSEPRNWRLDRIHGLELLDATEIPPGDFSLQAYVDSSFGIYQGDVEDVVLRVLPAGADDARRWRFHPTQVIEPQADGGMIVRFRASGMRELAWHLFTWGDRLEILAPTTLREMLVAELKTALARHG